MAKKKILVVDDTDWNRDLLVQLLEENYAVLEAVDGEQGVKATEQEKPDLILMDLGMNRRSCDRRHWLGPSIKLPGTNFSKTRS